MKKTYPENLCNFIKQFKKPLLAYSGGADSTYLLYVLKSCLSDFICVELIMPNSVDEDLKNCEKTEKLLTFPIEKISYNPLLCEDFRKNTKDRCYFCKKGMFEILKEYALKNNCDVIFDGTNFDDLNKFRPGLKAKEEMGIISPLAQNHIGKEFVLNELKVLNLPQSHSNSCYATRIPYDNEISPEKLNLIKLCENFILNLGVTNVRCVLCENSVKIDVPKNELNIIFNKKEKIVETFKLYGIKTTSLDLEGFISGKQDR